MLLTVVHAIHASLRGAAQWFEMYQGPSPYGQFFQDDISHPGVGIHIGL
jgi:hypothetical protein